MSGGQQHSPYRSSFSPTDQQHHPPFQSHQYTHPSPVRPPPRPPAYQQASNGHGHPTNLPPLSAPLQHSGGSRPAYYDPVDRSVDGGSSWGSSYRNERVPPIVTQTPQGRHYSYGGESAAGGPSQSPLERNQRDSYPLPSPSSAAGGRGSISYPTPNKPPNPTPMPAAYNATPAPAEPASPNMSTPVARGAMSISSLLSSADGPAPDDNAARPRAAHSSRITPVQRHSPDTGMRGTVRQAVSRAAPHVYKKPADADETDSDREPASFAAKKKPGFRDFKYHSSMDFAPEDLDKSESSDLDSDEFMSERMEYMKNRRKRQMMIEEQAAEKIKRRRIILQDRLEINLENYGEMARSKAREKLRAEAMEKVKMQEEADERERKKEQQRKRRREKAEVEKRIKSEAAKAAAARRDGERAAREESSRIKVDERSVPPTDAAADLLAEAQDSDVSMIPYEEVTPAKPARKKPGPKPKKFLNQPPGMPIIPTLPTTVGEAGEMVLAEPAVKEEYVPHASKSYQLLFDQIWKDIAKKEIPKVYRIQQNSLSTKQSNLRKTAQLASKEAQRWKLRTTKNIKDTQARAKRCMREMLTFWKRNEREERDLRRRAEKDAIERAKKEEEMREARRQARKLNFLISQTELYSHFIGRKIKTDEVERSTDSVDGISGSAETVQGPVRAPDAPPVLGDHIGKPGQPVTNFDDLDFDDEEALKQAAMTNAHHAIQAAQDRARAFNGQDGTGDKMEISNINLDEGEMNFQNPTSLGDIEIQQPKMLSCQLKEYQLKGLNWLCNLYEQGINGILADEMGLGKTVQSISVMAYLAEHHNIWGPFLVIAPASTLHNWQQEISRFVPKLKVIPYWGSAKDRKVLRKFWDRKSLTYNEDSPFHVLITSYQLVVQDTQYFQRMKWQYMILDEAQAIKSSSSSRWKALLGFHCRNRLLLTGTPIQNSMQELWALLHFIMPSLFDSHDEFSEWFSKDIESHAQSNTQLNEAQLRRLHMILKPFMLRRVKKHVQKELGDKIEVDVFCNLTFRQRAMYKSLRDKISIMDLIEKAASGGEENTATLMNLVMQFRKVCNHPDLFERADTRSPLAFTRWSETASFLREGPVVNVQYTAQNLISYHVPALVQRHGGRLDLPGEDSDAGSRRHILMNRFNIWRPDYINNSVKAGGNRAFSWLRFVDTSPGEVSKAFHEPLSDRAVSMRRRLLGRLQVVYEQEWAPPQTILLVSELGNKTQVAESTEENRLLGLFNVARTKFREQGLPNMEPLAYPSTYAPPVTLVCLNQGAVIEQENILFNERSRRILFGATTVEEKSLLENKIDPVHYPVRKLMPKPSLDGTGWAHIQVPSMSRFVSDSGKLAKLDQLLTDLKAGGHRVLLYFQMTRMMDLCEEYLTYRHHKYLRLDGSSKLEDRRDMVAAWQTTPEIFVFILSTRAGGLGINLTAADTVIFYDSDWNPTIDSQAMDRAHRLGQTKQVRVFRLITRGTIEERIRLRAQQKEEVQRVVIQGGDPNAKSKNIDFKGTREVATWLFDSEEAETLEKKLEEKEREAEEKKAQNGKRGKKRKMAAADIESGGGGGGGGGVVKGAFNIEDMYHEGEGRFDDSGKPSEAGTPAAMDIPGPKKRGPRKGNKKKTTQERLSMIDGGSM